MKRFSIGIGLLLGLFAGCLAVCWGMEAAQQPITEQLTLAAELSAAGNKDTALQAAFDARAQWQQNWHVTAAFADHTPMEEIDSLFRSLEAYDPLSEDFMACCLQLSQQTEAIAQAHRLNWWSFL